MDAPARKGSYQGPPVFVDVPLCRRDEIDRVPEGPPPCDGPPEEVRTQAPCDPPQPEVVDSAMDRGTLRLEQAPPEPILKNEKGTHIFSTWSALVANEPARETPPMRGRFQLLSSPLSEVPVTWYIELWAYEVARRIDVATPALPITDARLGVDGNHMSRLKAVVKYRRASAGTIRVVDLAEGIRLAVTAERVTVDIIYPQPGVVGTGDLPESVRLSGLVLDTLVGGFICAAWAPPGKQVATNTTMVRIPVGAADVALDVPPGARRLRLIQTLDGAVATPEFRFLRADAAPLFGPSMGVITMGAARTADIDRPGNAGSVTSGPADVTVDRFLNFVWELEV